MGNKIVMGIDPGEAGGIAVIYPGGKAVASKMPETPQEIYYALLSEKRNAEREGWQICCYLEKVGGIPGNGASAMFTFGQGYGWLEMALLAAEIPTITVTPQKWQKHYQLGSQKTAGGKAQWKTKLKAKAQQVFPELGKAVTLATADALLIANYGSIQERSD